MTTPTLNDRAKRQADFLAMNAAALRIQVMSTSAGARVIDCGVQVAGGLQAGLGLARVCLAGQAEVSLAPGEAAGVGCPVVQVVSDNPVGACLASQYAGWEVKVDGRFIGMGSGPMRAIRGKEQLFSGVAAKEDAAVAVGVLESSNLPGDNVIDYLTQELNLPADKITLCVAPASSIAGTLQVVARSLETALHKLNELQFDMTTIVSGFGAAPLPPVGNNVLQAIGRTNDAILYGSRVTLWVNTADENLTEVGPSVPSNSSADYGAPFAAIFQRYNQDFYKIDQKLFSPAEVVFHNLKSGRSHVFGAVNDHILRQSFFEG